jgi:hypothetical protein
MTKGAGHAFLLQDTAALAATPKQKVMNLIIQNTTVRIRHIVGLLRTLPRARREVKEYRSYGKEISRHSCFPVGH